MFSKFVCINACKVFKLKTLGGLDFWVKFIKKTAQSKGLNGTNYTNCY